MKINDRQSDAKVLTGNEKVSGNDTETKELKVGNGPDIENTMPANGHDICNYLARYGMANFQIQAVLKLNGMLDYDVLSRAVRLSIDAEPVLGCRFVESNPPYWKRIEDIDKMVLCSMEETDYPDDAVQRFLESPLDMDSDPMVKAALIRSKRCDTLCIKLNHACCDGAGAKEYILLLSDIYSHTFQNGGIYKPRSRVGGRKDQDKILEEMEIKNQFPKWDPFKTAPRSMWFFPWHPSRENTVGFVVCGLPQGHLAVLTQYARAKDATIHDLILTAYYRAMFELSKPFCGIPMDIASTVDLRRYLPSRRAEAIRNLSGGFFTRIARIKNETYEETLSRVVNKTKKIKSGYPGFENIIGGEFIEKMSFPQLAACFQESAKAGEIAAYLPGSCGSLITPGLSNLGFLSRNLIRFGERAVTEAFIIPPVMRIPGILLLACTYNGIISLSMGYYKDSIRWKYVEKLLNTIKKELIDGCVMKNSIYL